MLYRKTILQPRPERRRALAPLWLPFRNWLGRELNAPERKIVYTLENERRTEGGIRAIVSDHGLFDSRPILKKYSEWLISVRYPAGAVAVIASTRRQAYAESIGMGLRPLLGYPTRPEGLRGRNYDVVLYLDANGYVFGSRLLYAVTGTVSDRGVIIVHTRSPVAALRPTRRYLPDLPYDPPDPEPAPPPSAEEVEIHVLTVDPPPEQPDTPSEKHPDTVKDVCAAAVAAPEGKTAKSTLTFCK